MNKKELRILCPNGHLGFSPTKEESFWIGAKTKPDYYCSDSGSDDIGPGPLGEDKSVSLYVSATQPGTNAVSIKRTKCSYDYRVGRRYRD